MTTEPIRAEVVAEFLRRNPRYLELGLEVEAGLQCLRKEANDVVTSRLDDELASLERKSGWKLTKPPRSSGWLFSHQNAGWQTKTGTWSGVWLWRPSARSLDFTVGVEGWPNDATDLGKSLREAGRSAIGSSDAWSGPRGSRQKMEWSFRGDALLLADHRNEGIQRIIALVSALVKAAS